MMGRSRQRSIIMMHQETLYKTIQRTKYIVQVVVRKLAAMSEKNRGWLSHGLVVTLPISYSLNGGTLWGFTRDMRIAD